VFDLASFRGSKIQQLFKRLFISSTKRFINTPQAGAQKKEEVLSFLNLLLNPAFSEGKLVKPLDESFVNHLPNSSSERNKIISLLLSNISSKVLYPSISAQVLSDYIRRQMSLPQKSKDLDFRINLKTGVSMLAVFLFKRFPLGSSIRGLRIVCSGRWSKTRSGRKQRLVYNRGSLKRLTFSALLDYGMATVTTKFGVCSIKV
jgi:hypothetical protein